MGKIIGFDSLELFRHAGHFGRPDRLVLCHGVFDVLHAGHLNYFEAAKAHGDILVVSITTDRHINKGPGRPYFDVNTRARMISSLGLVNYVVITDNPTALEVIEKIRPAYYVKGPDYKDHSKDLTGEIKNEVGLVEKYGGKVVYTDTPVFSSSKLVNLFSDNFTAEQKQTIERVKELGGYDYVENAINELGKLKVLVVGEPIIDTYRFVEPQNISSKSPSISAKFLYEENYAGGGLAIHNHLESFCSVTYFDGLADNQAMPKKIRYIAADKQQRIFEVTEISNEYKFKHGHEHFIDTFLSYNKNRDATILADFGHGLFEGSVLGACRDLRGFVSLNVQTNSSNYGFNPFTKHKRFDYLSIDLRELKVAFHDNRSEIDELLCRLKNSLDRNQCFSVTRGREGATYNAQISPAFSGEVLDATGAGDAYFAITSLLVYVGCHPEAIPFIGNVFAGLKTKIIGNKSAVTKAQLLKALSSILK